MICLKEHRDSDRMMARVPVDQGGVGRHKCASCAYEQGLEDGLQKRELIDLHVLFCSLHDSQRIIRRHKSTHVAYALGYLEGLTLSYR